ncbi:hypothetical protein MNBD_GAMMA02-1626 [hydrothermal vent metagenome]|uniref:Uncharacterized protein n=1 Tax=hydrothermal vent metagenome TaxID=652676 RepID=A0A3B0WBH2_9ZZZZ
MKNTLLLTILFLAFTTPSIAATNDGSGNKTESMDAFCMNYIKAINDGSGTKATNDGSGTKATNDGSGNPTQLYLSCVDSFEYFNMH